MDADLRALRARAHITASSLHPGADWFHELSDGYGRIDVRMLMQTNDGAVIHVAYRGLVEPTDALSRAVQSLTPTAFTDQAIHTPWRLSTGDEQYRWVNRAVFIGDGRLLPGGGGRLGMQHNVYRLA